MILRGFLMFSVETLLENNYCFLLPTYYFLGKNLPALNKKIDNEKIINFFVCFCKIMFWKKFSLYILFKNCSYFLLFTSIPFFSTFQIQ